MAKYKFTQAQFNEISMLLKRRPTESRDQQKKTRARIRKLGFMISDYFNGFSHFDFKILLDKGVIEIVGTPTSVSTNKVNVAPQPKILELKSNDSKQALPPIVNKTTRCLVLGTMPGEKSLKNQEYYNNPKNQFWNIIAEIFNGGKQFQHYSDKLNTLLINKIGLWDVLASCTRKGSLDSNIKNQTVNNFASFFEDFPDIKTVIFNGQESYNYFNSVAVNKGNRKFLILPSTSSANTHKTLAEKIQEWREALT